MLGRIQAHLEAIYRIDAPDVTRFQIDANQLIEIMGPGLRDADEWVLVREDSGVLDLAVFVADDHIDALESARDLRSAAITEFSSFCAATEGVSHFLMLIERIRRSEPVSLLELEAQAEVDKFISARFHHPEHASILWRRLFREAELCDGLTEEEIARYKEAGRLAIGYCAALEGAPNVDHILRTLRGFWRASGAKRLDTMRRFAA